MNEFKNKKQKLFAVAAIILLAVTVLPSCTAKKAQNTLPKDVAQSNGQSISEETPQTSELYRKTSEFLKSEFKRVYQPYYDIQSLTISNWTENGNEATFFYEMTYLYYNREPEKADYIAQAKGKVSEEKFKKLCDDYLSAKQANYEFKIVLQNEELKLFANASPNGVDWQPAKIDDYVLSGME